MSFISELWAFLRARKKMWMLPIIIIALLLGRSAQETRTPTRTRGRSLISVPSASDSCPRPLARRPADARRSIARCSRSTSARWGRTEPNRFHSV